MATDENLNGQDLVGIKPGHPLITPIDNLRHQPILKPQSASSAAFLH